MTTSTKKESRLYSAFRYVILPILLVLVSLGLLLYPVIASQWNNYSQEQVARQYEKDVAKLEPEQLADDIARAHDYNREAAGLPILDPWLNRVSTDNVEYMAYLEQLNRHDAMSQVIIPKIDSRLPIFHGSDSDVLRRGIGHLYGSALPVGGPGTHTVLTGHTGLTNATLWDNLIELEVGDEIFLNTYGETLKYEVDSIEVVLPEETDSLAPQEGQDLITLITCTPYGINTHRLLIHGHRVDYTPEDVAKVEEATGFVIQWWMWVAVVIALIVLALFVWRVRRNRREDSLEN